MDSNSATPASGTFLTRHLDDVGESYFQHLSHALGFAATLAVAALACFLHALLPFLFEHTGSSLIRRLHDRMVVNRTRGRDDSRDVSARISTRSA